MAPVQKQYYLREFKKITDTSFFVNRNICVLQIKLEGFEITVLRRADEEVGFTDKTNTPDGKKWAQASEKRSTPRSRCREE